MSRASVLEICAGGGGQAAGLEAAGFEHAAAIELEPIACETLRANRPSWDVVNADVHAVDAGAWRGVDLFAGGVPCPPFSVAGKQLGADDERDLFPRALQMIHDARPKAVLLENVPGFASAKFEEYRTKVVRKLARMGYVADWRVLQASSFGLAQLRPRFVLVALQQPFADRFAWPTPTSSSVLVGDVLRDLMSARGWPGADAWAERAKGVGPTIVGGSKKHGGPDLGPTRARGQWAVLGVDGLGIANEAPDESFPRDGLPKLTVRMVARLQGFADDWMFAGKKTAAYRQVGNAFPPPVAKAVGAQILKALTSQRAVTRSARSRRQPVQMILGT
jgi:DNA (cytosine-5)-methyltransferase 1